MLNKWKEKFTWKHQLPLIPCYIDEYGNEDIDLAAILKQQDKLELDITVPTGFKGIGYKDISFKYEFGNIDLDFGSISEIAETLITILENYLIKAWDPKIFHLMFTSGGADSRILMLILKGLEHDGQDLGEFLFLCHGYESKTFVEAIYDQGWDGENWAIAQSIYDWGKFDFNMNGFIAPKLDFYSWLEKRDLCLVAGNYGGELLMYPTPASYVPTGYGLGYIDLERLRFYAKCPAFYLNAWYANYSDFLMPYLNYEYLDTCFQIKKEFFKREPGLNDKFNWTMDLIRAEMLKLLGNKIPVINERHRYEYNFSELKREQVLDNWFDSKFYKDFRHDAVVKIATPEIDFPNDTLFTRLYGLATCYEVI